jgi:hypothetical protein
MKTNKIMMVALATILGAMISQGAAVTGAGIWDFHDTNAWNKVITPVWEDPLARVRQDGTVVNFTSASEGYTVGLEDVQLGWTAGYTLTFNIDGGTMNIADQFNVAYRDGVTSYLNVINGGVLNATRIANGAAKDPTSGTIYVGAGSAINLSGSFANGTSGEFVSSDPSSFSLTLDGGTLTADDILWGTNSTITVANGGSILLNGDKTGKINNMIANSALVGVDAGTLFYNSGADTTYIAAAVPEPATIGMLGFAGLLIVFIVA